MDPHIPRLRRVLLRLWNDSDWQRAERERRMQWQAKVEWLGTKGALETELALGVINI